MVVFQNVPPGTSASSRPVSVMSAATSEPYASTKKTLAARFMCRRSHSDSLQSRDRSGQTHPGWIG